MHESQENNLLQGEQWRNAPMQKQRGLPRALALLWRGVCLRCPRCGARSLFRTWFAMYERCAVCGLRFEREQGYFLGAMYINYGVTVVLALLGSFALEYWTQPSLTHQLVLWVGFCTVFPVLFFRHSRGLWLGFDFIFDPEMAKEPPHTRTLGR
jgi:uncharacterized protein (DUF983 family)